ncbi:MAG: putative N-acetyl-gamma-glutamyl-phosphate reductase, chloroplastic [Rickettsiaceae bacterium]|jgi:N-acetyl-gamma-glutamyl-phosphate reductase|nr:putative N-acetyl-gamma-glutamyl-phosphate reductase, chloroplastic [Rickettsiaceae bacterium]
MKEKLNIAIIGASGYTGVELIRLLLTHSKTNIKALIANSNAGQEIADIYPHLSPFGLPPLQKIEEVDFTKIDVAFCCLPHTTSQETIKNLMENKNHSHLKIIDLSADFRLENIDDYKQWYGHEHVASTLQPQAVYGLSEINRAKIKKSNLIANPGCYPTSVLLPLLPLIKNNLIETSNIVIDSKSGASGAGRSLKLGNLYCEVNDGMKAYGIANHRHTAEIEQELGKIAGGKLQISFTPHLVPMSRGIISTIYVSIKNSFKIDDLKNCLETQYQDEYFVNIVNNYPGTHDVFASNFCNIGIFASRLPGQVIIVSVIDNLVKGASGQAVQNMNIIFGFDEKEGLAGLPVTP